MDTPSPRTIASARWDVLDVLRGVAIVAMIVYHFSWDLSFLQLTPVQVVGHPGWNWFARGIAGSFLLLSGIGLALAHAGGFRRLAFLRRLVKVGGAALAVTLVTALVFPQSYIFFGILHAIAVGSVLAVRFLRAPAWATLAVAAFCLAAPRLFRNPALDTPLLDWLGLGARDPVTNDYVPVFPWLGLVLAGLVIGRALLHRREALRLSRWRAGNRFARALAWAGRKSLPIYLIHQPVLFGVLYGVLHVTGPNPQAQARPFIAQCVTDCTEANGNDTFCRTACSCVVQRLREDDTFDRIMTGRPAPEDQRRISEAAQICLRGPPS